MTNFTSRQTNSVSPNMVTLATQINLGKMNIQKKIPIISILHAIYLSVNFGGSACAWMIWACLFVPLDSWPYAVAVK